MTDDTSFRPILAGLAATLVAAAVGLSLMVRGGLYLAPPAFVTVLLLAAFPIALVHALTIAAPLYFALLRRCPLRWWNAALAGFFTGALPASLLALFTWSGSGGAAAFWAGVCGMAGGLVFRAVRGPVSARILA